MRFERLRRSRAFAYIKGPLLHIRNFLTSPVLGRVDGVHAALSTQQRLIGQALDRSQSIEGRLSLLEQKIEGLRQDVGATSQSVGFLHHKADDAAVKTRPVIHAKGAYAVPLRDGYLFVPEEEEGLLLMYTGAGPDGLEPGTRRILQMITPPNGCAIDVGASVGLHTLALARAMGPSGRLFAFEAEPRLERYLRRTLHANGLHQVILHMLAAGKENTEAVFHVARTIGHSSLYALESEDHEREALTVHVRQLDEIIPKDLAVDVIKIDVEGAELDVLQGAAAILERSPECAIVAELGPSHLTRIGMRLEDWVDAFRKAGFSGYAIEEPSGMVTPIDLEWLARQHSVNVLFVRSGSFARAALTGSHVIRAR